MSVSVFWSWSSIKCTLTSSFKLCNLPNLFIRCNMSYVVSLSLFTVFIFLYSSIEKVKVIAIITIFFFKFFNSIENFIQFLLWSCHRNSLKPSNPKLLNKNISFFGWRSRQLHQCIPFLSLRPVFIIINRYCILFLFVILWNVINFVLKFEGKTPTKFFWIKYL